MGILDNILAISGRPDPAQQIAMALHPPMLGGPPGPVGLPGNGAPDAPPMSGAPSVGPSGAPQAPQQPQAYQVPQDLGSMFLQLTQQRQASESFDRHLGLLAASMYPGRRPDIIMHAMSGGGQDPAATFQSLLQIQGYTQEQQRYADLLNNAPAYAKSLGTTPEAFIAAATAVGPQGIGPLVARIAENRMGIGGVNLEDQQYIQERAAAQAAGQPFPGFEEWKLGHQAQATTQLTQAKDAQDFKDSAVEDFQNVDQKFTKNEQTVDTLLKDMPATMKALQYPDFMTSGKFAANAPGFLTADQATKNQAAAINTLKNELSSEGLRNVKNVRNIREFNTLAGALTSVLDPANSPDAVEQALRDMKQKFVAAHATSMMAAGKQLTGQYVGQGDRTFLSSTLPNGKPNPYYNGATEAKPAQGEGAGGAGSAPSDVDTSVRTPADVAKLPKGTKFLVPDGSGRIGIAPGS